MALIKEKKFKLTTHTHNPSIEGLIKQAIVLDSDTLILNGDSFASFADVFYDVDVFFGYVGPTQEVGSARYIAAITKSGTFAVDSQSFIYKSIHVPASPFLWDFNFTTSGSDIVMSTVWDGGPLINSTWKFSIMGIIKGISVDP